MGGIEAGLKQGSFRGLGLGFRQGVQQQEQNLCKGSSCSGNGRNAVVFDSGDYSFADQFLNLQTAGDYNNQLEEVDRFFDDSEDLQESDDKDAVFLTPPSPPLQPPRLAAATEDDFCSVLILPEEEEELEWLSQFMEDSFSPPYPAAAGIPIPPGNGTPKSPASFWRPGGIPLTPHSKRRHSTAESATSSSSSSSATSSPWPPTSPSTPLTCQSPNPFKNKRSRTGPRSGPSVTDWAMPARSCSHCGTQKTPQWRTGPTGGRTLCNACGVRFKAGRLFPEYRPASSPTFSSEAHSNSNRKVLEMRRKKEIVDSVLTRVDPV